MSNSTWMILLIFFVVFIVLLEEKGAMIIRQYKLRKRGKFRMTKEFAEKLIGKTFRFNNVLSSSVIGEVLSVEENWIEIKTKSGIQYISADYLSGIQEVKPREPKE